MNREDDEQRIRVRDGAKRRGVENGELQNDVQPTILAKIMMSLFYGRAFQDSLINGMDPKLLKEEMLAVYEMIKR